jgi:hypothetical protein
MTNNPQVIEANSIIDQLLPLVEEAERKLKSARNWSILDILGGGFIVDLIKHHKLNSAANLMNEANMLLQRLQQVLGSVSIPPDYRMTIGGFLTFADFLFDGIFADAYMASKIFSSLDEVRRLKEKLHILKNQLRNF